MYATTSFKTKKAFREAVAAGKQVGVFQPGPFGGNEPTNGTVAIEGPNYEMHRWYASATLKDGVVVKVK
jgi:hypothetical protein